MAENTNEQFEVPTAAELVDQLRTVETEPAGWNVYENEVFAQVFEFTEHRRLQVWDEADLSGTGSRCTWGRFVALASVCRCTECSETPTRLTQASLYWFSNTIGTSLRPYYDTPEPHG